MTPQVTPMVGTPQGMEWVIILIIVLLLFGAKKLPELARNTGRSLRIFKAETKGLIDDDDDKPALDVRRTAEAQRPAPDLDPVTDVEQPRPDTER